jgi:23S rRNA A2030 N6-methylase RlmJ
MKRLELTPVEVRTLRDMGISHSHPRTRMRAQAIVRLSQGLTLQQVANEFAVHLNSVEHWRQRWNKDGFTGLYEGSPELNRIEILRKQAKYFWRRFCSLQGDQLLNRG